MGTPVGSSGSQNVTHLDGGLMHHDSYIRPLSALLNFLLAPASASDIQAPPALAIRFPHRSSFQIEGHACTSFVLSLFGMTGTYFWSISARGPDGTKRVMSFGAAFILGCARGGVGL